MLQTGACHNEEDPWQLAGTQTLPVPGCSLPWLCVAPPAVPHSFLAGECVCVWEGEGCECEGWRVGG